MSEMSATKVSGRQAWEKRIRGVHLLEGETVVGLLDGSKGLVEVPTRRGALLALTERRVLTLLDDEDRQETHMASIDKIQGVSMRSNRRSLKPLLQGVLLILAGIIVYLVVGTFSTGIPVNAGITISALLGGAVALLGLLFVLRYLFWERGGEIVFQTGGLELVFPYRSQKTIVPVHELLRRFFQLQSGMTVEPLYTHTAAPSWPHLLRMPAEPAPPLPEEAPAVPTTIVLPPKRDRRSWRKRFRSPVPRVFHHANASTATRRARPSRLLRLVQIRRRPARASRPISRKTRSRPSVFRQLSGHRHNSMPALGRNGLRPGRLKASRRRRSVR